MDPCFSFPSVGMTGMCHCAKISIIICYFKKRENSVWLLLIANQLLCILCKMPNTCFKSIRLKLHCVICLCRRPQDSGTLVPAVCLFQSQGVGSGGFWRLSSPAVFMLSQQTSGCHQHATSMTPGLC